MTQSLFSVGGLASGMDTQSIIDKLVQLESQPVTLLQQRQSAYQSQVSALGKIASLLGSLETAATNLGTSGALANQVTSSNTSFSAVAGSGAIAGTYDVQVSGLATAAKWRSGGFGAGDTLQKGTLHLTVDGKQYPPGTSDPLAVTEGESLEQLASAIRATGAPVSAAVLDNGTSRYLSITAIQTGYESDGALSVDFTAADPATPGLDPTLSAAEQDATNASFSIDKLSFTRTSNTISDALPGTTLTLKAGPGPSETLTVGADAAGTQAKLQTFVDAYNAVMRAVQSQTSVDKDTDRSKTLAGDSTVRTLEQALQSLGSSGVAGLGTVRSLADLGVKTAQDGTLSIDSTVLSAAIARDPSAVNTIFSDAAKGIAKQTSTVVDAYTQSGTGLLVVRQAGLQKQLRAMSDQAAALQARIDSYRDNLVAQFTAMENVVGQLKSIGNFLTAQENAATR